MVEGAPGIVEEQMLPPEHQELADRLAMRFKTQGIASLNSMLHARAKTGSMVMAGLGFFIWLSIFFGQDPSSSRDTIILDLGFHQVALLVTALAFLAAIFNEMGNELGRAIPGLLAGPMTIVAGIYMLEPMATSLWSDSLEVAEGAWRTVRLAVILAGATYGARLIMEAAFLVWLRDFCDIHGFDPRMESNAAARAEAEAELLQVEDILA